MASESGGYEPLKHQLPRRREHTIALWLFSVPQAIILGVALGLGLFLMTAGLGLLALVVTLALGFGFAYIKIRGAHLYYWVPVSLRYLRRRSKGDSKVADEIISRRWPPNPDEEADPPVFRRAVPGLKVVPVPYRGGRLAILQDDNRGTYGAALTVSANSFCLMEPPQQDSMVFDYGQLLDTLASEASIVTNFSWFSATRPSSTIAHERFYASRVVAPDDRAGESYAGLITEASAAPTHEIILLIQTDKTRAGRTTSLRKIRRRDRARKSEEDIYSKLMSALDALAHALMSMGLRDIQPLTPAMFAQHIRHGLDPGSLPQNGLDHDNMWQHIMAEARRGRRPSQPSVSLERFMSAFAFEEAADVVRADGTLHQVLLVEEYPTHDIGAAHFQPLLNATTPGTVVWRGAPEPASATERRLEHQGSLSDLQQEWADRTGTRLRRSRLTQHRRREAQLDDLEAGASTWRFVTLIDVPGNDELDLAQNIASWQEAAGKCGLTLRIAYLRQLEALTQWCLPVLQEVR